MQAYLVISAERRFIDRQTEGRVDFAQQAVGGFGFRAQDDPGRVQGIVHGRALCQKLGVGGDLYVQLLSHEKIPDELLHEIVGPHGDRGFDDDETVLFHAFRDLAADGGDIA